MVAVLGMIGLTIYGADAMISCIAAVDFGTSKHAGTATGIINGCGSVGAILGGLLPGYLEYLGVALWARRRRVHRIGTACPALEPDAGCRLAATMQTPVSALAGVCFVRGGRRWCGR